MINLKSLTTERHLIPQDRWQFHRSFRGSMTRARPIWRLCVREEFIHIEGGHNEKVSELANPMYRPGHGHCIAAHVECSDHGWGDFPCFATASCHYPGGRRSSLPLHLYGLCIPLIPNGRGQSNCAGDGV